jgi:transcriptional regulator with XRE-family HTH domain
MGLIELSKRTGLSPALLSKLGHGKLYPTRPTLSRISLVLSVGLDFFTDEKGKHAFAAARRKDRLKFPGAPGMEAAAFEFESLHGEKVQRVSCGLSQRPAGEITAAPTHGRGIYLRSELALKVGSEEEFFEAGDSLYFDSLLPHGYSRVGNKPCSAIAVTAE